MFGLVAFAGVIPITQRAPTSTKLRLRAIRLSGSPASCDASVRVKHKAILWITNAWFWRVIHRFLRVVDNFLRIFTPTRTFKANAWSAINLSHHQVTTIRRVFLVYGAHDSKSNIARYALIFIRWHLRQLSNTRSYSRICSIVRF